MKKKIIGILVLVLAVLLLLFVRPIEVRRGKDLVDRCPPFAIIGTTVHVEVVSVTDADLDLHCSGADLRQVSEWEYTFRMPAHKVYVDASIVYYEDGFGGS